MWIIPFVERGAARVYSPQKGATAEMVEELDKALRHFVKILKKDLHKDVADIPGAGAAGGLGAGLLVFLGATLRPGIDIVIEAVKLEDKILNADLVITGEGRMDEQTVHGKAPYGVAKLAGRYNKRIIGICGMLGEGAEILYQHGFQALFSNRKGSMGLEEAMRRARELTIVTAERAMRNYECK